MSEIDLTRDEDIEDIEEIEDIDKDGYGDKAIEISGEKDGNIITIQNTPPNTIELSPNEEPDTLPNIIPTTLPSDIPVPTTIPPDQDPRDLGDPGEIEPIPPEELIPLPQKRIACGPSKSDYQKWAEKDRRLSGNGLYKNVETERIKATQPIRRERKTPYAYPDVCVVCIKPGGTLDVCTFCDHKFHITCGELTPVIGRLVCRGCRLKATKSEAGKRRVYNNRVMNRYDGEDDDFYHCYRGEGVRAPTPNNIRNMNIKQEMLNNSKR